MARAFPMAVLVLLLVAPLAAQEEALVAVGDRAPGFTIADLDGQPVDVGALIGTRPLLIEFWATWCTSCEAMLPRLRAAHERYGDDVTFLGVNVTISETLEGVRKYVRERTPPFRTLYDADGEAARAYGPPATSWIVVVDRSGTVAYVGMGGTQNLEPVLRRVAAGASTPEG